MKERSLISRAVIFIVTLLGFLMAYYLKETKDYLSIPSLEMQTIEGDLISTADIKDSKTPCAFVFFHPECSFCREEIDDIMSTCVSNHEYKWFFVTTASPIDAKIMFLQYDKNMCEKVYVVSEEDYPRIHLIYDVTSPPAIFLYNSKGRLYWHRKGELPKGTIASIIK